MISKIIVIVTLIVLGIVLLQSNTSRLANKPYESPKPKIRHIPVIVPRYAKTKTRRHKSIVLASRKGEFGKAVYMNATAYDPGPRSCGASADGITATGMKAGKGVVAVDPHFIKLGTKLYVEGYGVCIAGDVGGAIHGNKIDLGFNTYSEAIKFGRKKVVVYIIK